MQFIPETKEEKQAIPALGGEVIFSSPDGSKVVFTIPGHQRAEQHFLNNPMIVQPGPARSVRAGLVRATLITAESQLQKLQESVEKVLKAYSPQIYAVYKETTTNDLSYYILLAEDTPALKQAILGKLYAHPIEQLRQNVKPVYYIFFPKHQEELLSDADKLVL